MNDKIVALARELIKSYGYSLLDDPERLGQLLEDKCGDYRHEIFLLCFALKEASRSASFPSVENMASERDALEARFCDNLGFSPHVARWAFDAISTILADVDIAGELGATGTQVEARKGFLRNFGGGIAKKPRTAAVRKKAFRNGLLLLVIVMLFLGLYARTTGARYPVEGEHRVLFLAHLSGNNAAVGHVRLKAAQLAADQVNDLGGVKGRLVRILVQDLPQSEAAPANLESMLRQKNVTAMISACNDEVNTAIAKLADDFEIPLVCTESSRMSVTMTKDRPWLYSFRTNIDNDYKGKLLAYFTVRGLKRKKIALLSVRYDEDSGEVRGSFLGAVEGYDAEVVSDLFYTRRAGIDNATVSEALSGAPDIVVLSDSGAEAADIVQTLKKAGYAETVLGLGNPSAWHGGRSEHLENTWWIASAAPDDPQLLSFQTSYRDKFNESVSPRDFEGTVLAYDSVMWMADALYRAPGFQGEALRHAFLSTRNLGLAHATITIDPRTHGPWNKAVSLIYRSGGHAKFQRRFRPQ